MSSQRTLLFLLLLIALFLPSVASARAAADDFLSGELAPHVPNQLVVKLGNKNALAKINKKYNTELVETFLASSYIYLLQTNDNAAEVAQQMQKDGRVKYVELNYLLDAPIANPLGEWAFGGDMTIATEANPLGEWAFGGNSADNLSQYAVDMLDLPEAHTISEGNRVTVAILDTGVQANHPFLTGSVSDGYDFVDDDHDPADTFDGVDNDDDGLVDEAAGHGTHVAGIIHLTAPDATIMPIRVLDSDGRGNLFLIAEAIRYAAANGADVINLSLGTPFNSQIMADAVEYAESRKALVVAAAGNAGQDVPQYPAAYPSVLSVGAVDQSGTRISDSNFGTWVNVSAPGLSIYSSFPSDAYAWWSGTSMSAPFVAGTAALVFDSTPNAKPDSVMSTLIATSVDSIVNAYDATR